MLYAYQLYRFSFVSPFLYSCLPIIYGHIYRSNFNMAVGRRLSSTLNLNWHWNWWWLPIICTLDESPPPQHLILDHGNLLLATHVQKTDFFSCSIYYVYYRKFLHTLLNFWWSLIIWSNKQMKKESCFFFPLYKYYWETSDVKKSLMTSIEVGIYQ